MAAEGRSPTLDFEDDLIGLPVSTWVAWPAHKKDADLSLNRGLATLALDTSAKRSWRVFY